MKIGEFFLSLGIKADTAKISKVTSFVKAGVTQFIALGAAAAATAASILAVTNQTVNSTVELENFRKQTGLSIAELQKWQKASALSDVSLSTQQVAENIKNLQKNLTDLQFGKGNLEGFRWLGIDVSGKNAFQVLEQVRQAIKGIDDVKATNLIQKIGLSPSFINVLRTSRDEFDKLGQGWFLNNSERKKLLQVGTALTKMKLELIELRDKAVANFAPEILSLIYHIKEFGEAIFEFGRWIKSSSTNLLIFQGVLATLAVLFAPIPTIIALVAIALQDLYVAFRGGDSIFGRWWALMSPLPAFLQDLYTAFKGGDSALGNWWKIVSSPEFWDWGVQSTIESIKELWEWIKKISESGIQKIFDVTMKIGKDISGLVFGNSQNEAQKIQNNNSSANANITNNFQINTTANANETAQEIAKENEKVMNFAFSSLQGGSL